MSIVGQKAPCCGGLSPSLADGPTAPLNALSVGRCRFLWGASGRGVRTSWVLAVWVEPLPAMPKSPHPAQLSRRSLLAGSALSAVAACSPAAPPAVEAASGRSIPIAVSTYSFWHFRGDRYPVEKVIDSAAEMGFDGVEVLHRQMEDETPVYVNMLKRRAWEQGLSIPMLSIHQDFVSPEAADRQKGIDHTKHCLELSARLGSPAIRLNTGRWGTSESFDDLMANGGVEPPIEGYDEEDAIQWCIDSINECVAAAEETGVVMALENHWGISSNIDNLLRIYREVDSPWLQINMDTGNYVGDPYPQIEKLAPHASVIQAKTYYGGGEWYTLDLDYPRIAKIVSDAGFEGFISLEMEGKEDPATAVPKSLAVLREAFG